MVVRDLKMKKILFVLLILIVLVGCVKAPAEEKEGAEKKGEILELTCGLNGKDVDFSCTSDADCTLEKIEAFCFPSEVAIPTCGPTFICDTSICKAQCMSIP